MKIRIKNAELVELTVGEIVEFPKYTTQIINLANQNAQGTRPAVVGQMSDLIEEFPGQNYEEWVKWYQSKEPEAIVKASEKIFAMIENLKVAIIQIDEEMVRKWVKDLVHTKTFVGLRFQKAILKKIAERKNLHFQLSSPDEESKGIDGYIGGKPVSIKPITYKTKNMLQENITVNMVFYDKKKDGLTIEYDF